MPPQALAPARFGVDDKILHAAIQAVFDEDAKAARTLPDDKTFHALHYEQFARTFAEARVPDCLHGDALKRQPARIGPIAFQGTYAIPFVLLAKLRGKCN